MSQSSRCSVLIALVAMTTIAVAPASVVAAKSNVLAATSASVAKPSSTASSKASSKPDTKTKPAPSSSSSSKEKEKDKEKEKKGPQPPSKTLTTPNATIQKSVAGASPSNESNGAESPELKTLRDAELELFVGAAPLPGTAWPSDLPSQPKGPLAMSGGLPPEPIEATPIEPAAYGASLSWLSGLKMPDLPVRWDARVVRYLEFFKDDPRGRRIFSLWWRRSGRYRELVTEMLRARSMPEDLVWVAMAESGFDPLIKSPAGAAGLWQFMPDAAKIYGLTVDRWADFRNSPARATEAAINFLGDLKKRFGTWELALAAYNMGYGGALAAVKKFNSNDFWELSKFENGLPWETSLYVPKIIAMAIVARNPQTFGYDSIALDSSLKGEPVEVPAGSELKAIASLAGCNVSELTALNPELKAGRTPPAITGKGALEDAPYTVFVPIGKSAAVKDSTGKLAPKNALERYVVRFGETLDQIAVARKTTKAKLVEMNGIAKDEVVRGGTVLLVPPVSSGGSTEKTSGSPIAVASANDASKPNVLVPGVSFAYPDRARVFYRVIIGDTPRAIAEAFSVTVDELRTWNAIEPTARLQEGMTLQVFVPKSADLSRVVAMKEGDVKILAIGSDDFYALEEAQKGRKRTTVYAGGGETLEAVGKKYGIKPGSMEKINRRPRTDVLAKGEAVIVYVPTKPGVGPSSTTSTPVLANDLPAKPADSNDTVDDGVDAVDPKPKSD